ncbi:IgGFc-binding protein-like [Branchiostoma floridae x Branchiostoma belcheri]
MARVLLSGLVLVALFGCSQAALDNKGTEFILTFPENFQRDRNDPKLFITCPHPSGASVEITYPRSGRNRRVNARFGQVQEVELRREDVELRGSKKSDGGGRAVHVTADVEIVVYGVFAELKSSDAYLALPTDVLGTEYFAACSSIARNRHQEGWDDMPAQFGVAGVHDGTDVTIIPSQDVEFDRQDYRAGQPFTVRLDRFETLQVQASEDLTGSKITATHPVAVLSGNLFAYCRPMDETQRGTGDHLVQMIPPVDTWGKEFVTVPLIKHRGGDLFRVIAARDNTQVDVTNENTMTLNTGEFWEIDVPSDEYRHVTSSEPVLLVQYSKTGAVDNTATDPFMMIIPNVAQFEAKYTISTIDLLYDPSRTTHHINLVTSSADKGGLLLDGQRLPSDTDWHDVPGTDFAAARMDIDRGTHTVGHISPIVTTGLFSYGYTNLESYGYPGGLRLARIAASCSATAPVPGDRQDNDCDGRVDEELLNGRDDDGDGLVDEDLATGNCADHRDQYRECLVQKCRSLVP